MGGLSADLIPDPKCGVDIRLSPTISQVLYSTAHPVLHYTVLQVDEDGAGRPARSVTTVLSRVGSLVLSYQTAADAREPRPLAI